ncbi:MAG: hypothetical protein A2504_13525 [Bdellovibrionales bacterium RIFOXYD12_FULL_39_22]|nr:MAG: hypothetical protein A2385_01325 [Bdellovibrionales bacterium RIFOXYB1_FULL_39_21]OFZ43646.1 MAG: hypothetical protein A2485_12995 [Bdellovibrionales bacterium RIFOXYC12_FULL_39_17]OFZ44665.1 MAG: hypothetical protein A2404_10685 [Bdellovibrionales bacterium RIFOXYC1_FULL_39_130]OFZ71034.1 MAG: hypothetical protein A2451_13885 [Bdellovibrionales bacterium RIFOXYC2_FULL_39_8]OFZ76424.1 MAG: hypothetical protein A2560_07305 [Bdellovibrionales bacterium RIFOXYD1_FULL_39_84]OFZ94690.1 MAG:
MKTIFHITTKESWNLALSSGSYKSEGGFIHCSLPHQILGIANFLFKQANDLLLLNIDQELLESEVKYEGDDEDKFPHVYGNIELDAVVSVHDFFQVNGVFVFPENFELIAQTLIRPAVMSDAAEITNVNLNAWKESYVGIISDKTLRDRHLYFARGVRGKKQSMKDKNNFGIVAETHLHGIVGISLGGKSRDIGPGNELYEHLGEICAFYLLEKYKGLGIGKKLLIHSLSALKKLGFNSAYCWVLCKNPTLQFYEHNGAKKTNHIKTCKIGEQELLEESMVWSQI